MGFEESYAFNGGESFAIGGTSEDYESLICTEGRDAALGFTNKGVTAENVIPVATNDMSHANLLFYKGADILLKV